MPLPPGGSPAWRERGDAECELLFARGLGALRAGYMAMTVHAIERLLTLSEEWLRDGQRELACNAGERACVLN